MTKITNELLEDYAMNYYSIMRCIKVKSKKYLVSPLMAVTIFKGEIEYIQLRSIESIPRRLVKLITKIQGYKYDTNEQTKKVIINNVLRLNAHCIDLLRKEGYATPFRGITVYELVESGKLKLI